MQYIVCFSSERYYIIYIYYVVGELYYIFYVVNGYVAALLRVVYII